MQYLGGKARMAHNLAPTIIAAGKAAGCRRYVEPFIGGASIFARVAPRFAVAEAGDCQEDLVLMWQAALSGWKPPTEISRVEYAQLRTAEPSALRGFVGFGCSFGGKWFGGYASNARGDDFCGAARRGVLKKAQGMAGTTVCLRDYADWDIGDGDIVYCDPPYGGTTGYAGTTAWSADRFWRIAYGWADNGAVVLVSEYKAPLGWVAIGEHSAVQSLRKDNNKVPAAERLFISDHYSQDEQKAA